MSRIIIYFFLRQKWTVFHKLLKKRNKKNVSCKMSTSPFCPRIEINCNNFFNKTGQFSNKITGTPVHHTPFPFPLLQHQHHRSELDWFPVFNLSTPSSFPNIYFSTHPLGSSPFLAIRISSIFKLKKQFFFNFKKLFFFFQISLFFSH